MIFNSDYLDDCCEQLFGHTNWAYFDTLSPEEQKRVLKEENVIVFFKDPADFEEGE